MRRYEANGAAGGVERGVALAAALPGAQGGASSKGCLVTRWENVWVVWTEDKSRSFVNLRSLSAPAAAACKRRATAVNDELSEWEKRGGGDGPSYALGASESSDACALDGCVDGKSPFASGTLVLMHNGSARAAVLAAPPPTVPGLRRGGTDAANAATWRLTSSPLGMTAAAVGVAGAAAVAVGSLGVHDVVEAEVQLVGLVDAGGDAPDHRRRARRAYVLAESALPLQHAQLTQKKRANEHPHLPHTRYSLHSMPMSPPQARMIPRRTVTRSRMIDRR